MNLRKPFVLKHLDRICFQTLPDFVGNSVSSFVANFVRVGNSAVVAFYVQVILKVNTLGLFCHFYDENI